MQELKQSTQIKVRVGPFVDVGDGFTPETGITLGVADEAELLKHNGAATVSIAASTWAAVTGSDGWYDLTLTITDTNTLGQCTVVIQDDSVCLPVFVHFMIVSANFWDSKFGAEHLDVNVVEVDDDTTAADNLELMFDGTGYAGGTIKQNVNVASEDNIDFGATRKASINTECDTALSDYDPPTRAELTTDKNSIITEVDANETKIDTIDGIVDSILIDTGTTLDGKIDTIDTNVDAILVDTGTTLDTNISTLLIRLSAVRAGYLDELAAANLPADIDAILTDTGTTLDGKITTIDTVVDAIKVITDALPNSGALTTIDANIDSILADTGTDGVVLTAAAIDAILDEVVEDTLTLRQAIRLFLSALSGKSSGGGTVTLTFRDNADSKNRISATVDANGNRTAMTLDGT